MSNVNTNRESNTDSLRDSSSNAQVQIRNLARFPEENPNPVLRAAVDGTVLYANHAAKVLLEILGWTKDAKLPQVLLDQVLYTASISAPTEFDFEMDGRTYSVALSPGAKESDVNLYLTDITRRKEAERELRESREDLNRAQAVAHVGSWRLDVRQNELLWSDENHRIFGIPQGMPMTYETFLSTIHPEDKAFVDEKWKAALDGEPYDIEHRIIADGHVKWVRERCELEFDELGNLKGGFGTTQDITKRKRTEQSLQELNKTLEQQVAERTSAFQMLHDVTSMANLSQNVQDALEYCLKRVAEKHGWDFGLAFFPDSNDPDLLYLAYAWYSPEVAPSAEIQERISKVVLQRGQSLAGSVYNSGKPKWSNNIHKDFDPNQVHIAKHMGIMTAAAFPVIIEQRVVGVLQFLSQRMIPEDERMYDSMISIGTQIGRVIERKIFQDRLLSLAEEEHRRIGQELHDDVGQELTGLALKIETLVEILRESNSPSLELAKEIMKSLERTRRKSRALSRGLIPSEIDPGELQSALEDLALRTSKGYNVNCRFQYKGPVHAHDHKTATQLYRIAREAVANAVSHAQAREIQITLNVHDDETILCIEDDGIGMPPKKQRGSGMGLQIMRYRAGLIRAQFEIHSSVSGGTKIVCRLGN